MRVFLFLLPLIFFSCHRNDPWQQTAIRNSDPTYDLAKLSHPAASDHRGIQIEFIRQEQTIKGYLNVHTFAFPPLENHPKQTSITFLAGETRQTFVVDRLAGGQRLRLSPNSLDALLQLLHDYPQVTIQSGHYSQTYSSDTFDRHYRKLCKLPPRLMPEKLVTFELY